MLVYKLVRFYEPESEAQYETTRATLTVFSEYFMVPGCQCADMLTLESHCLDTLAADNVWRRP